jgi:hypothetical protein
MPRKERYQTRLDPDDAAAVDEFAEEREIGESEAVRRLIRAGIEAEAENVVVQRQASARFIGTLAVGLAVGFGLATVLPF